ncbi:MAG: type II toxin-antitoxin system VapC family toxin [Microvirga sp.]
MPDPVYMLDTNVCIYIRRERPPEVLRRFKGLSPGSTGLSIVTYGELCFGARKSQDPERASTVLGELVALIPVLPLSEAAGEAYGTIRHDLASRGEMIGNNDLWIAAHALSLDMVLVTNNEREFNRVRGLKIENWILAPSVSGH